MRQITEWRSWRSWEALRVALIAAWSLWAVMGWWSAPRPAEVDKARAAIAANEVAVYQWADSWERPTLSSWGSAPTLRESGSRGPLFVWRTDDGRTYYVVLDKTHAASTEHVFFADGSGLGPETESVSAAVMESLLDTGRPPHGDVLPESRYLATAIGLIGLAILIGGPAPVIGTRWYWFWLTTWIPLGLGVLAWLILERPWSRRIGSPPDPGVDQRQRGLAGLGIGIVAAVVLGMLGVLLRDAFDIWLIPELPG